MYDKTNIFAKIINKEVPARIVYENEYVIAFYDIAPVVPIHIVIAPKGEYIDHADFIAKANLDMLRAFFASPTEIAQMLGLEDYRLVVNKGSKAGQTVFHFHMHFLAGTEMGAIL